LGQQPVIAHFAMLTHFTSGQPWTGVGGSCILCSGHELLVSVALGLTQSAAKSAV
jgi:hypothetical protein